MRVGKTQPQNPGFQQHLTASAATSHTAQSPTLLVPCLPNMSVSAFPAGDPEPDRTREGSLAVGEQRR